MLSSSCDAFFPSSESRGHSACQEMQVPRDGLAPPAQGILVQAGPRSVEQQPHTGYRGGLFRLNINRVPTSRCSGLAPFPLPMPPRLRNVLGFLRF